MILSRSAHCFATSGNISRERRKWQWQSHVFETEEEIKFWEESEFNKINSLSHYLCFCLNVYLFYAYPREDNYMVEHLQQLQNFSQNSLMQPTSPIRLYTSVRIAYLCLLITTLLRTCFPYGIRPEVTFSITLLTRSRFLSENVLFFHKIVTKTGLKLHLNLENTLSERGKIII